MTVNCRRSVVPADDKPSDLKASPAFCASVPGRVAIAASMRRGAPMVSRVSLGLLLSSIADRGSRLGSRQKRSQIFRDQSRLAISRYPAKLHPPKVIITRKFTGDIKILSNGAAYFRTIIIFLDFRRAAAHAKCGAVRAIWLGACSRAGLTL